jgi:MFS family permease
VYFKEYLKNSNWAKGVFSSLESRNYRYYFFGQSISLIGTWIQNIALSWLVYRLTGSVFLLGLIGFTGQIPTFVISPFAGVFLDRYDRLKILKLAQVLFMIQALIMAVLVLLKLIQVWQIIALSLLFGLISAFDAPARQSLVIHLIDKPSKISNAIALNSAVFNGARLIGPAIAGIIIGLVGEGICFLINAVSFIAVIYALLQIKIHKASFNKTENFKKSFKEGFQYTFKTKPIKVLLLLLSVLSLFGLPYIVLLPAYAKEILGGGADTLGFLMSAAGAGAFLAALYMAARKTVIGLGRLLMFCLIIFGISMSFVAFSPGLLPVLILLFFAGFSMIASISSVNTMIQTISDEDKRGRVMSFYAMALLGIAPIGNLLAGAIASAIGIPYTLLIGGITTTVAGLWFSWYRKYFRQYVRPIYRSKGILPALPAE